MRYRLVRVALAVAVLALGSGQSALQAQGLTGQISGTVTDSGGGVLPGATVTIKNAGTSADARNRDRRRRRVPVPRPAGRARTTSPSRCSGFKTYEQKGIELGVDRARRRCARSRSTSAAWRRR